MTRRLLILSCSARKRSNSGLLPAIDRYDGPLWRVLRCYLRENPLFAGDLDIYALSSVYGLIPAQEPVPWYEQKMTISQADVLQPSVIAGFQTLMTGRYQELCVALSQLYMRAMQGWKDNILSTMTVLLASGSMGTKQQQVRAWLYGEQRKTPAHHTTRIVAPNPPRGAVTLCGVPIRMTREAVLEQARQAFREEGQAARRFRHWYVRIDGQRIAPKWLVSRISGIPTSRFDAGRARAVLLALGVDVEKVS